MSVIYKYPLAIVPYQTILLHAGAGLLSIQEQKSGLFLWAKVDPKNPHVRLTVYIFGTGHEFTKDDDLTYITTVQMKNELVWHIFVKTMDENEN